MIIDIVSTLKKMNQACPVRNDSIIRLEDNNIVLEWQWKLSGQKLYKTIKISLIAIARASDDIVGMKIDSLYREDWDGV